MGGIQVENNQRHRGFGPGWLFGTSLSACIAAVLIYSVRGTSRSVLVPIVFIVVIILCARYFGVLAGILGSILGTILFAFFLFEPYGTFHVGNHQALFNLGLLLFAGIALSYANSERDPDRKGTRSSKPE